jgi:hypothetical protein
MTKKIKIVFFTILQLAVLIYSDLPAQNRDRWMPPPFPDINRVIIFTDPLAFYPDDSNIARLDIYIEVPIPNIIFKRNPSTQIFESSLTISINIQDFNEQTLNNKVYNEQTSYTEEEMNNEKNGSLYYLKTFYQNPGISFLNLRVRDNNSGREFLRLDTINIKDKSKKDILFSDIMILSDYKADSEGKKEITPLVNNNAFNLKDFYIFFEIYNNGDNTISKQYAYKIKNDKDKIISEGSFAYNLSKDKNKEFEKLDFFNREPSKYKIEILDMESGEVMASKQFVFVPNNSLYRGIPMERRKPRN